MEANYSPFLRIPTELRLLIYTFALQETAAITVGTAELVGAPSDIVHRLYGDQRKPHPGIPTNHEPVIEPLYNPALLSITNRAIIPLPPAISCPPEQPLGSLHTAHVSLPLVNRQIHAEIQRHLQTSKTRNNTQLFVAFPHGLHLLTTLAPNLVHQARSIHLAGVYHPRTFDPARAAVVSYPYSPNTTPTSNTSHHDQTTYHGNTSPNTARQLGALIASLFGPNPRHPGLKKLELRIYYPGATSYTAVWGDDDSPTCVALRSIYAGEIGIEVWRGQRGTGVYLTATRPKLEAGEEGQDAEALQRKRVVSTVWRRLEEGRRGEPKCGSWVVDPKWPEWDDGLSSVDASRGDAVVSMPW